MFTSACNSPCHVVYSDTINPGEAIFGDVIVQLAHSLTLSTLSSPDAVTTILDLRGAVSETPDSSPLLCCVWISKTTTPSTFSISCAGEHLKRHLAEGHSPIVTIFNDPGDLALGVDAASYLIVLKQVDLANMRCVPVNFSTIQKSRIRARTGVVGQTVQDGSQPNPSLVSAI